MKISVTLKKKILFILFILLTLGLLIYLSPTATGFDENYTLALINHGYNKLVYLDSMDVHPILYYLLLKLFIQITTFWTSSIIIKVLSARIFSLIISVLLFIFLYNILKEISIKNNIFVEWILFLVLPGILNITFISSSQIMNIRMYSLAALFISIEFFYLIKYRFTSDNRFLILVTIFAILAAYTHYYATIFSGLLLFVYLIQDYIINNKSQIKYIFISIVILVISFMPWLLILIKQIENPNTYWLSNSMEIKEIIKFLALIILFYYPFHFYKREINNKMFFNLFNLYLVIIITFVLMMIYMLIKGNIFQCRYMFPILIIYEFISINIVFKYLNLRRIIFSLILVLNILLSVKALNHQIPIDYNSIKSVNVYHVNNNLAHNTSFDSGILTNILLNNKRVTVKKPYKAIFKSNIHAFHSYEYRRLFKSEIDRINIK